MLKDQCRLVPNGSKNGTYSKLRPEFQNLVLLFINSNFEKLKNSTLLNKANVGARFLFYLQENNLSICTITEDDVISFFMKDGKPFYVSQYRLWIASFFESISNDYPEYRKISVWVPRIRETRKNIQYLTTDEVQKIKGVCLSENSNLSYCDKAIGLLLLYTGIRAIDIASLTRTNIDWNEDVIHLVQSKTSVPITIPMVTSVGNSIYDYIEKERDYDGDHLFITRYGIPFKSGDVSNCVNRIFKIAGIRQNKGDRKGTHIFRHHLAAKLLENEVAQPVISQQLGHTDPTSVETYLSADIKHLRQCALSIEPYTLDWEVFDNA